MVFYLGRVRRYRRRRRRLCEHTVVKIIKKYVFRPCLARTVIKYNTTTHHVVIVIVVVVVLSFYSKYVRGWMETWGLWPLFFYPQTEWLRWRALRFVDLRINYCVIICVGAEIFLFPFTGFHNILSSSPSNIVTATVLYSYCPIRYQPTSYTCKYLFFCFMSVGMRVFSNT